MTTIPFTYLLKFKQTGQVYYGVRYREGCNPSELWATYFSSSKVVKSMIAEFGKDCFDFEIRKKFNTKKEARDWEQKVLIRMNAANHPKFLNRSNNMKGVLRGVGTHIWCYNPVIKEKKLFKLTELISDAWIRNSRGPDLKQTGTFVATCNSTGKETKVKSKDSIPDGYTLGRIRDGATLGTYWITKVNSLETKLIKIGDSIPDGWYKGNITSLKNKGKMKVWRYLDDGQIKCISIDPATVDDYISIGWNTGNPQSSHCPLFKMIDGRIITKTVTSIEKESFIADGWYSGLPICYTIEFVNGEVVTLPYQMFLSEYGIKHDMIRYSNDHNTGSYKYQYKKVTRIGLLDQL